MENSSEFYLGTKKGTFPANVAEIIDDFTLIINKGAKDGIRQGQRVLVYRVSEEDIKDPNTGKSLGIFEIVKGAAQVIDIQNDQSTIRSIEQKRIYETNIDFIKGFPTVKKAIPLPFENPEVGDLVKPI